MNPPAETPAPFKTHYSHAEAVEVAKTWMRENYGIPKELNEQERDRWMTRLGTIVDFLHTLHPPK